MKDISYYTQSKFEHKAKSDFTSDIDKQMETFIGTKLQVLAKEALLYDEATKEYRKYRDERQNELNYKLAEFKLDLAIENCVENNPKLEILWGKAWDHGHSCGLNEVKYWFEDLVELID